MERRNLLDHFKVQENKYAATFKMYSEKVEHADEIEKHLMELLKLQIEKCPEG